jgi:AraC-like DNA-binding protein
MNSIIMNEKVQHIHEIAKGINGPKDYYSGTTASTISLPQNIILFHRDKISANQKSIKHHRFLLTINCQGKGDVVVNGQRFHLGVGSGILVFPFQHHHYANQEEPMFWLKITFELPTSEELEILRNSIFEYSEEAVDLIFKIASCYQPDTFKKSYYSNRIAFLLGALLNEINQQLVLKPKNNQKNTTELRLIDQINRYIINNIHTNLGTESIAHIFHYSESHLRALYRKEMQISLGAYIQEIRLHKAQEYLGSTDMSISEIAELCGYTSLYVFSNAFKKSLKISPNHFRKNLKTINE